MEFAWTDEHRQLRETVRELLASRAPLGRSRELVASGGRHDPQLWAELAAVGLPGLAVPEQCGGSGGTLVDLAVVAEEMGRVLLGGPFLPTVALAAPVLLAAGDTELPARIADGSLTAALALAERTDVTASGGALSGVAELVLDGADADVLVVLAEGTLYAVERGSGGREVTDLDTLDLTRRMATVRLHGTPARRVGVPGDGGAAMGAGRDAAAVLLAAEQVGGMAACVATTAEYARTRRQFGRLIGSFQGVKHRLADMAVRLELARSAAYWAAWQPPGADRAFGAAAALAYCSEAFLQTALDTVQLHGGIGFTWEHDAHLFVRRARADYSLLGEPAGLRARLEPAVLDAAERLDEAVATRQEVSA